MITEELMLNLLKVQSNLSPKDFKRIYGERSDRLFQVFARENWNLVSFIFNKVNGEDRQKLIDYVNMKIEML